LNAIHQPKRRPIYLLCQASGVSLADGPDEVHRDQVGRLEIAKYN